MSKITTIAASIAATLFLHSAQAQAPEAFSYSGIARNNGQPVSNTQIGLQLSVVQGSPTGTSVYTETQTTTTDTAGYFSVAVGGGTPTGGTFAGINWASGNHYLKVGADFSGGSSYTDLGTTQLLSVPYALCAKKTANGITIKVNGTPISDPSLDFVTLNGANAFVTNKNYGLRIVSHKMYLNTFAGIEVVEGIITTDTATNTNLYLGSYHLLNGLDGEVLAITGMPHVPDGLYYISTATAPIMVNGHFRWRGWSSSNYDSVSSSVEAYPILPNNPAVTGVPNNLTLPLTLSYERQ